MAASESVFSSLRKENLLTEEVLKFVKDNIVQDTEKLSVPCKEEKTIFGDGNHQRTVNSLLNIASELDDKTNGMCAGLAANQIGHDLRVFIAKDKKGRFKVHTNPVIISKTKPFENREACFSFPESTSVVKRYKEINVKFAESKGIIKLRGLDAIVFQHELDHLNGIAI
jgi:peptide deformylase